MQWYNLFSPVMMITWWMKLGGSLPPGHGALGFSISGTGWSGLGMPSRTDTFWTCMPRPALLCLSSHGPLGWGGENQSAPAGGRFEPPTCRSTGLSVGGSNNISRISNGGIFSLMGPATCRPSPRGSSQGRLILCLTFFFRNRQIQICLFLLYIQFTDWHFKYR